MRINFIEKKRGHFESDDGRFTMTQDQTKNAHKFFIHDLRKDKKVGAPTSFVKAVSLVRRYLLEEKQKEGNPSTIPTQKIGDNVIPLATPKPTPPPQVEEKSSTNGRIILAHLASIADSEGFFKTRYSTVSRKLKLDDMRIRYWFKKFIKVGWLVELEPSTRGEPGSYGFNLSSDEVQKLIQNMPTKVFDTTANEPLKSVPSEPIEQSVVAKMPEPKPRGDVPSPGILAGRALVKVNELETKVDKFIRESNARFDKLASDMVSLIQNQEKPDMSQFETILDYLETSQQTINNFMKETFGVEIK